MDIFRPLSDLSQNNIRTTHSWAIHVENRLLQGLFYIYIRPSSDLYQIYIRTISEQYQNKAPPHIYRDLRSLSDLSQSNIRIALKARPYIQMVVLKCYLRSISDLYQINFRTISEQPEKLGHIL